jgi:ribonuclease-3 family protein
MFKIALDNLPSADQLHPRALAHLGDCVYELHIRLHAVKQCSNQIDPIHQYTIERVNAAFQAGLLKLILDDLNEEEQDVVRRGRNLSVPASRRSNQAVYRQATGFEVLIGYLYLKDPQRLLVLWQQLEPVLLSGKIAQEQVVQTKDEPVE